MRALRGFTVLLLLAGTATVAAAQDAVHRRMAVTVDDLPQNSRVRDAAHRVDVNARLVRTIVDDHIPAVGFVNASKCYADGQLLPHQRAILQTWVDAGLALGNHTWSHPDYTRVDLATFTADVERGEPLLRELLGDRELRWFRHPYLHRGDTDAKREALEAYLTRRGYREAPVTIDNGEWIYAVAYDSTIILDQPERRRAIGEDYVRYMLEMVRFWEDQSQQLFGRNIDHVLLIHANALNADWLDELIDGLRSMGYGFVTLDEALRDPAYGSPDHYSGPAGISWLHRWALTRDVDRSMFLGEPEVPDWIGRAAGY